MPYVLLYVFANITRLYADLVEKKRGPEVDMKAST
jgi:hypothetical protein